MLYFILFKFHPTTGGSQGKKMKKKKENNLFNSGNNSLCKWYLLTYRPGQQSKTLKIAADNLWTTEFARQSWKFFIFLSGVIKALAQGNGKSTFLSFLNWEYKFVDK